MKAEQRFHVYLDWTTDENPRVFYVGKGMLRRVKQTTRSKHHASIAAKHGCRREIVLSTDSESEAFDEEIRLIAEHRTFVYSDSYAGFGCNYTAGGDGASGGTHSVSEETRTLLSRQKIGNRNAVGYRKTAAQRANQSRAMKGRVLSEETKFKIRISLLERNRK